jgi:hypothetical protein
VLHPTYVKVLKASAEAFSPSSHADRPINGNSL